MNIVNDEFIIELEKDYEYGRTHIRELWNLLIEKFPFIENDELGAYVLEQAVNYRSSKKNLFYEIQGSKKVEIPLSQHNKYISLDSDIKKIVKAIYSPVYDKMEKNYLDDESEQDAYRYIYSKNHERYKFV